MSSSGGGDSSSLSSSESEASESEVKETSEVVEEQGMEEIAEKKPKKKKKKKVLQAEDTLSYKLKDVFTKINQIQNDYITDEKLYEDIDFPDHTDSLFIDDQKKKKMMSEYQNVQWRRPKEVNKDGKFCVNKKSKCDMKFGNVSDGAFTGALGLVSIHPCIDRIIVDVDNIDMGYAVFQFFKNGEWRYVIIDTRLPYCTKANSYIFSYCNDKSEFWVQLVEKAYAKLNGCYEFIQDMDTREVLVDLTGGVCERFSLGIDKEENLLHSALYSKMVSALKHKYILGCIKRVDGKPASNKDTGDRGILENHYHGMMMIREVKNIFKFFY